MGRRERDVLKKWRARIGSGVIREAPYGMIAHGSRGIKIIGDGDRFPIFDYPKCVKVVVLTSATDVQRPVKTLLPWIAIHMPFPGMVGAVAGGLEKFWEQSGPCRPHAIGTTIATRQGVAMDRLCIKTRQQRRSAWPTSGCIVTLRKTQSSSSQTIQVRRVDLAAIAAHIRKTQIVREDDKHVRRFRRRHAISERAGPCYSTSTHHQPFESNTKHQIVLLLFKGFTSAPSMPADQTVAIPKDP